MLKWAVEPRTIDLALEAPADVSLVLPLSAQVPANATVFAERLAPDWSGKHVDQIVQHSIERSVVLILPEPPHTSGSVRQQIEQYSARIHELLQPLPRSMLVLQQNGGFLSRTPDLWLLCETIDDHRFRLLWSLAVAKTTGESTLGAIPVLNSRIASTIITDTSDETLEILHHFRGIGFTGPIIAQAEHAADALQSVTDLRAKLDPPKPAAKKPATPHTLAKKT